MSFNGSGVMVIDSAGQPVVASTLITAAAFNALTADLATALSTCVLKDGTQTITQNIPFNNKKITGLAAATARTDGASIATVQDGTGVYVTGGGTANAITLTPSPAITAYAAGQTFRFIAGFANTSTVTVAVSGLAAKDILKLNVQPLAAGDISVGLVTITYDGTRFLLAVPNTHVRVDDNEVVSTSGTTVDFTSIPLLARRITIMLIGVSTNSTSGLVVQLGDAGGVETTGYDGAMSSVVNAGATACIIGFGSVGFIVASPLVAAGTYTGKIVLDMQKPSTNTWVAHGTIARLDTATVFTVTGSKATSAALDRVRVTTVSGDTFDAGAVNISYE